MGSNITVQEFIEMFARGVLGKKRKLRNWQVEEVDDQQDLYFFNKHSGVTKLTYTGTAGVEKMPRNRGWSYSRPTHTRRISTETIAYRYPDGSILYNANVLWIATRKANGVAIHDHERSNVQIYFDGLGAKPLPFTIFRESGTRDDIAALHLKVIMQGSPETVQRKTGRRYIDAIWRRVTEENGSTTRIMEKEGYYEDVIQDEHFIGACIYEIDGTYYLFDYDRKEQAENKIFNPFVVELPGPADDFDEAYALLMPDEVKKAKASGIEVQRQGEFFFILHSKESPVKIVLSEEEEKIIRYPPSWAGFMYRRSESMGRDDSKPCEPEEGESLTELQKEFNAASERFWEVRNRVDSMIPIQVVIGGMTHHTASCGVRDENGVLYVTGTISHTNREHGDLTLLGWWKVVSNTAVRSVTIQGRID